MGGRTLSRSDRFQVIWYLMDGITHLCVEGPFLWISLTGTAAASDSPFAMIWKEYGKADRRWAYSDPGIVALEVLTVLTLTPLCFWLIDAIRTGHKHRYTAQLILAVCELYGGWMTFGPEWVSGSPNLLTWGPNWVDLWIFLFFCNILWVWIPLPLAWESIIKLGHVVETALGRKTKKELGPSPELPSWVVLFMEVSLAVYVIVLAGFSGLIVFRPDVLEAIKAWA